VFLYGFGCFFLDNDFVYFMKLNLHVLEISIPIEMNVVLRFLHIWTFLYAFELCDILWLNGISSATYKIALIFQKLDNNFIQQYNTAYVLSVPNMTLLNEMIFQ